MKLNLAIIEDTEQAYIEVIDAINRFCNAKHIQITTMRYTTGEEFLHYFDYQYDVVFMDIRLPGMNGMEIAKKLRSLDGGDNVTLIFVTNYVQYAVEGYEVNAFDYILKPINYNSFAMKLDRLLRHIESNENNTIMINSSGEKHIIDINSIMYIDISGHDICFHRDNGETLQTTGVLNEIESNLNGYNFSRCSASCLVNLKYVKAIFGYELELINSKILYIGRTKKKQLMNDISSYLGKGKK